MSTLYPIIRRVRRALLPPEETRTEENRKVCERPALTPIPSPPGEGAARAVVELPPVVADSQSSALPGDDQSLLTSAAIGKKATPHPGPLPDRGGEGGDDQSLLTSAATKGMKGKREAAKSRVKAADEAHSTQP